MDARGSAGGRLMLARTRDRCKSAFRRAGYDRDRIDTRYRVADDRGAQGRWADMSEPQTRFPPPIRRVGGRGREVMLQTASIAKNYIAISTTYEFAVLF